MKNKIRLTKFILLLGLVLITNGLFGQSIGELHASGLKALALGEITKAINIFNQVIEQRPYYYDAYAARAEALARLRKNQEALEDIAKVLEMKPDHAEALFTRSRISLAQGKQRQALQDLDKATSAQVILVEAWIAKARLLQSMGRAQEARDGLDELIRRKGSQTPPVAYILRSQLNQEQGLLRSAIDDLSTALTMATAKDSIYLNRAHLYLNIMDTLAALSDIDQYLASNRSDAVTRGLRANILMSMGKADKAMHDLNHLIDIMKIRNDASLYVTRARASLAQNKYDEALQDLSRAMIYDRKNAEIVLERAAIYGILGKEAAALADFNRLMRMDVKDYRPWLGRAKYFISKEKYEQAIQDLNEAIKINPNAESYYYRGACYDITGDRNRACEDLKRAAASGFEAAVKKSQIYCP